MRKKNRGRNVQRERRIFHGRYLDVHIFPVFKVSASRCKRERVSNEIQQRLNQKYREEKIKYLINTNFTSSDIEVGLGFENDADLPSNYSEALRILQNFFRRLKRYIQNHNMPELKYIYTIEKGETNGRWHYHIIINQDMTINQLKKVWKYGYIFINGLEFDDEGLKGIARYLVKEPQSSESHIEGKIRRWNTSKNLKQPYIPKDRDGFISRDTAKDIREGNICEREIERLYPGYTVTRIEAFKNKINAGEYVKISLRQTESSPVNTRRMEIPVGNRNDGEWEKIKDFMFFEE